jgi:Golgi nucleoside diphosphatase
MTTFMQAISDFASHSTIAKRHEIRHSKLAGASAAQSLSPRPSPEPIDDSVSQTLAHLFAVDQPRSTIYQHHDQHHHEMHHEDAMQHHMMAASMAPQRVSIGETLSQMWTQSSIFVRNERRNTFLHSSS